VYDMYHWDRPAAEVADPARRRVAASPKPAVLARGSEAPGTSTTRGRDRQSNTCTATKRAPGAQAVQVALDRRDNGGDSSASRDQ
jgi:hypothetical protein